MQPLHPSLENLWSRLYEGLRRLTGLRRPRVNDIFERVLYLWPHQLRVRELGGSRPYAAFNPGAVARDGELLVFPRLITGYFWYTSVVGLVRLRLDDVLSGKPPGEVEARIVLHPRERWDLAGCEDPRVSHVDGKFYILYTALEPRLDRFHAVNAVSRQALAVLSEDMRVERRVLLRIAGGDGAEYLVPEVKDSALLRREPQGFWMLLRPHIGPVAAGWRGFASLNQGIVNAETLEPILLPEPWEFKVGWSTNAVEIGSDEYLVAWHGVGWDMVYRTGFAVVNGEGELLGITTSYLLEPRTVQEMSGERPGVIFGCGLIRLEEQLLMVAGFADTGFAVYRAELDRVMEEVRWLKG